jgi:hypothetical protein
MLVSNLLYVCDENSGLYCSNNLIVYSPGDPELALLQMQKDDADLAHKAQKPQSAASSSQMPTVSPTTPAAGCAAQQRLKRKSSSTDIKTTTTNKRVRVMGAEQTATAPEAALGHFGTAATAQPEEIQRPVPMTTGDRARAPRAKAAAIFGRSSNPPASSPVPTSPQPDPAHAPISTTNTIANLATATVAAGANNGSATATVTAGTNNGPATANYSQLIPKILRSFPAKGYTLPLSEIYGQIEDWKRSHGITIPIVKQSIRASLNRLQDTSSNSTATVEHVKAPGARTGKWRLSRPQDWQPLITILPGNAQAAAAQVTVPGNATASAAGPSQASAADGAARNAQMMAAEALALLGAIEVKGNGQDKLQAAAPTAAPDAASAQDPIQYPAAGNENAAPGGPPTVQGSSSLSSNAVGYPSPSTSTLESTKLAIQGPESLGSSSENASQENPFPRPGTSSKLERATAPEAEMGVSHGMAVLEVLADAAAHSSLHARAETSPNLLGPQVHDEAKLDIAGCMRRTTL